MNLNGLGLDAIEVETPCGGSDFEMGRKVPSDHAFAKLENG